jgi:hypothetical protein
MSWDNFQFAMVGLLSKGVVLYGNQMFLLFFMVTKCFGYCCHLEKYIKWKIQKFSSVMSHEKWVGYFTEGKNCCQLQSFFFI